MTESAFNGWGAAGAPRVLGAFGPFGGPDGSNPDAGLLRDVNGLTRWLPRWADGVVCFLGEYGLLLAVLALLVWCWWRPARRRDDAPAAVAQVAWAGLAGLVALALSVPIRQVVQRPRPYDGSRGLHVLLRDTAKYSFVGGHSTVAMAVGVALFLVHRRAALAGVGLALLEGFTRVLMGANYPTDVVGGFALGTATALLLAPAAQFGLVPLARRLARSRAAVLVRAPLPEPSGRPSGPADPGGPAGPGDRGGPGGEPARGEPAGPPRGETDLAA